MPLPLTHPDRDTRAQVVKLARRYPQATQAEVAAAVGVTPQRVGQIMREEKIARQPRPPLKLSRRTA